MLSFIFDIESLEMKGKHEGVLCDVKGPILVFDIYEKFAFRKAEVKNCYLK